MDVMLLLCLICYLTIVEDFRFLGFCHSPVNSPSWVSDFLLSWQWRGPCTLTHTPIVITIEVRVGSWRIIHWKDKRKRQNYRLRTKFSWLNWDVNSCYVEPWHNLNAQTRLTNDTLEHRDYWFSLNVFTELRKIFVLKRVRTCHLLC